MFEKLVQAVAEFEEAASNLSDVLKGFDLSRIPYCEKDLNQIAVGEKVKVAKFLIQVLGTKST